MEPVENHYSLINLPKDIQKHITKKFHIRDMNACMRVSKLWDQVFSSDTLWKPIQEELGIELSVPTSLFRNMVKQPIIGAMINPLKNILSLDYKHTVRKYYVDKDNQLSNHYPVWLEDAMGGIEPFRRLPVLELCKERKIKTSDFTAPIVLGIYNNTLDSEPDKVSFMLLRIRDNENSLDLYDVIIFKYYCNPFDIYKIQEEVRSVNLKDQIKPILLTDEAQQPYLRSYFRLDRIERLLRRQPLGKVIEVEQESLFKHKFLEGPQKTRTGRSTLELR